jgi:hypothetical protein
MPVQKLSARVKRVVTLAQIIGAGRSRKRAEHRHIRTFTKARTHTLHTHTCIHTQTHARTRTHTTHARKHTNTRTHTHARTQARTHTHGHTHTHTYHAGASPPPPTPPQVSRLAASSAWRRFYLWMTRKQRPSRKCSRYGSPLRPIDPQPLYILAPPRIPPPLYAQLIDTDRSATITNTPFPPSPSAPPTSIARI